MIPIGTSSGRVQFGVADRSAEYEAIFRLNHATFAGEIPQHPAQPDGRLVDRFHAENEYVIGVADGGSDAELGIPERILNYVKGAAPEGRTLSLASVAIPVDLNAISNAAYSVLDNVFDNRYATFGTFFDTTAVPNFANGGAAFTDARTVSPARPRSFYAGIKATF